MSMDAVPSLIIAAIALFALIGMLRGKRKKRPARAEQVRFRLGNHTLTSATPSGRIELPLPAPGDIDPANATMRLQCTVELDNYLAINPGGHFAIVMRADLAEIANAVWGQGCIGGSIYGRPPCWYLESWFNRASLPTGQRNNIVFTQQRSKDHSLKDGVAYTLNVESVVRPGQRLLRMQVTGADGTAHDTGYVPDPNILFDPYQTALVIGHVFASGADGWALRITNAVVTWEAL